MSSLSSLQELILEAQQLQSHDEDYRRLGPDYREPVYFSEVLALIVRLAREIDDVRQTATTVRSNQ